MIKIKLAVVRRSEVERCFLSDLLRFQTSSLPVRVTLFAEQIRKDTLLSLACGSLSFPYLFHRLGANHARHAAKSCPLFGPVPAYHGEPLLFAFTYIVAAA